MDLRDAFDALQQEVNADPEVVGEARRRRDVFMTAFLSEPDVLRVIPAGSLSRGSQIEPINDVDLVIVFAKNDHPGWGSPGNSAEQALGEVGDRINLLLGATNGSISREVRLARPRNHVVKCWLDEPENPDAFTVDVAPALEDEGQILLIPEKLSADWIRSAPEVLNDLVKERHASWSDFVKLVRVLKRWNRDSRADMKSLFVEVLALGELKVGSRPEALAKFFTSAAIAVVGPIEDPAGLCGEIQPGLDRRQAQSRLEVAAAAAWRAVEAAEAGNQDAAMCYWREVFGPIFPEPEAGCSDSTERLATGVAATSFVAPRPVRDAPQGL